MLGFIHLQLIHLQTVVKCWVADIVALDSQSIWQKLRGGVLLTVGYLLSPLCWWNDLIINLPIAYGFGYLLSLWHHEWFLFGAIAGYWLSNLVGIFFLQVGTRTFFQSPQKTQNLGQEIRSGLLTSTAYTLIVGVLIHFHFLSLEAILPVENFL